MKHKHELEAMVAQELGVSRKKVREVVTSFLSKVMETLTDLDEVHLATFGRFKIVVEKPSAATVKLRQGYPNRKNSKKTPVAYTVSRKFRIHFKKSPVFARILRARHGSSANKEIGHG